MAAIFHDSDMARNNLTHISRRELALTFLIVEVAFSRKISVLSCCKQTSSIKKTWSNGLTIERMKSKPGKQTQSECFCLQTIIYKK